MWTEVKNNNNPPVTGSKMVDPDLSRHLSDSVQQRNGSTAAATNPDESLSSSSGIVPGVIAAAVFITFLLALYAVLWRCMVSPPQRKHSKVRVRVKPTTSV